MKLFRKTEVWRPTVWGFILVFMLLGALGLGLFLNLYPFLAQNRPLPQAELIIIEGWLEDAELARVLDGVSAGQRLVAAGGPVRMHSTLYPEKTFAEITAVRLRRLGVPPQAIIIAPAPDTARNRTYVSALAVRDKLAEQGLLGHSANLYSLGAHSRRSFLLYRLALGPETPLGVVSLESEQCDLRRWWTSSLAFKHVLTELISWFYIQCTRWEY